MLLHPSIARPAPVLPAWPWTRAANLVREVLRTLLFTPAVARWCSPRVVLGREHLPARGPVIFVANHASHADTVLLLRSLPRRLRLRCAPAAAADYFFRNRLVGVLSSLVVGAFAFPRNGSMGLRRARALLDRGWSVLLYPEGTRSTDGRTAPFRRGFARLAVGGGATIVPVGIAGTREVLGKGRKLPRRAPVAVAFGEPIRIENGADVEAVRAGVEAVVERCAARAEAHRPAPKRSVHAAVRAFASSPAGPALAFAWGVAEALWWPVVPDLIVVTLVLAAPRRVLPVAAAAVAGSLAGGAVAYAIAPGLLDAAPLVTDRMREAASASLRADGAAAVLGQPFSGIPFKVYAYQASAAGAPLGEFVWYSLAARGARIAQFAALFAATGVVLRRWIGGLYPFAVAAYTTLFFLLLARVVHTWS